jgi:hypothetical protein
MLWSITYIEGYVQAVSNLRNYIISNKSWQNTYHLPSSYFTSMDLFNIYVQIIKIAQQQ